jgi:hypothetical protein
LPIGTRDRLALSCQMISQASARSDPSCRRLKFAPAQRVEEITCEYDALALPVGEALSNQVLDTSIQRLADLAAKAPRTRRGRFTSDELAVKPSGAGSPNLRLDREVGTHGQRDALAAGRVLEPAELDDAARRGVARSVEVGQTNMMSTRRPALGDFTGKRQAVADGHQHHLDTLILVNEDVEGSDRVG